jgi:hypothetical protein
MFKLRYVDFTLILSSLSFIVAVAAVSTTERDEVVNNDKYEDTMS